MNILYDYQIFQMQNYGGISRYFYELIKHSEENKYKCDISLLISSNEYVSQKDNVIKISKGLGDNLYKITNLINAQYSRLKINHGKHDVFHPTYFTKYYNLKKAKPYIITVYDLIMEKLPKYFINNDEFLQNKKKLIENANKIIAISNNTKQDILEHYNVSESNIDVTYLAESLSDIESSEIEGLPEKYILFVGNRSGYKNFINLYKAAREIFRTEKDLHLVCAGGGAFSKEEKSLFIKDRTDKNIIHIHINNDHDLKCVYENAELFVFPSFYEGFGIPVLESFASKCLTCLSDSSSLKEIGGDSAIYFNPYSVENIQEKILHALLLNNRENYINSGVKQSKKYSWLSTSHNTFETYKSIL